MKGISLALMNRENLGKSYAELTFGFKDCLLVT